jgi:2'-5' RNA ligase
MSFLGIRITPQCGRLLAGIDVPGDKEGTSEYHITLLCFEDNWPITEIAKALEATYDIVCKIKPFIITTEEITCFPKREDNPVPIIAKIKSKELLELRENLAKEFEKRDIEFSKIFKDYKPHITLSYSEKEIEDFKIDEVEFVVQEIVLWGGDHGDDRIFINFPLKGPAKQKHAVLLQKTEIFEKIANNTEQKYFAPSMERRKVERL